MEAFVVVLLDYSDDPREVSEIRASEVRARALADSLASKLDGPEFQAKLEALKQREVRCPFLIIQQQYVHDHATAVMQHSQRWLGCQAGHLEVARSDLPLKLPHRPGCLFQAGQISARGISMLQLRPRAHDLTNHVGGLGLCMGV